MENLRDRDRCRSYSGDYVHIRVSLPSFSTLQSYEPLLKSRKYDRRSQRRLTRAQRPHRRQHDLYALLHTICKPTKMVPQLQYRPCGWSVSLDPPYISSVGHIWESRTMFRDSNVPTTYFITLITSFKGSC